MLKLLKILTILVVAANSHVLHAAYSFQGSIWPLTDSGSPVADSELLTKAYSITLGFDSSSNVGRGSFLDQVAINGSSSFVDTTLFDDPGGASAWSLLGGGMNARGCSGSGSGFECSNSLSLRLSNSSAGVSNSWWVFDVPTVNGEFFTDFEESSVKGRFVDVRGNKVGDRVSENVTLTSPNPEPEIYAMMLAGLGLMGYVARRRNSQGAVF